MAFSSWQSDIQVYAGLPHLWTEKSDGVLGASPPAGVKEAAPSRMSSFFELVSLQEAVSEHFRSDFNSVGLSDRPSKIGAFPKNRSKWQPCVCVCVRACALVCVGVCVCVWGGGGGVCAGMRVCMLRCVGGGGSAT